MAAQEGKKKKNKTHRSQTLGFWKGFSNKVRCLLKPEGKGDVSNVRGQECTSEPFQAEGTA